MGEAEGRPPMGSDRKRPVPLAGAHTSRGNRCRANIGHAGVGSRLSIPVDLSFGHGRDNVASGATRDRQGRCPLEITRAIVALREFPAVYSDY